ncbi:MAG: methyltransferase domain-containing protein [Ilumatobacter sp.]|uniref:methyltransferase domain-containing protein n=1 Tax=Ilumatobacter sp. TaxID=1967498 RepID=UPI0039195604
MKVGVLVVAYNAESTLHWVLDRIPATLRRDLAEVLVMDDHSTDDTFAVAHRYANGELPLTIVRHERNLGYGGNQKAGYRYAIDHGWDVVVLLHGDGQYAPEKMPDLLAPILDGDADAVFGSRMLDRGGARRGGMPMYKFVGNRILTTAQNAITGAGLSEWHSGYRAYRTAALADLDFVGNSDDFDFDTEIILQLLGADKRIVEVPIPTYYGDEISRVNGIAYAKDIMVDTIRHRLGEAGFGRGELGHKREAYEYKPSPNSSHGIVLELVPDGRPLRILDVGCGPGWVAAELRRRGHHVTGVDITTTDGVSDRTDRFFEADVEGGLPDEVGDGFDVIIAADVIEHVRDPDALLADLAGRMEPSGMILASVPNFGHWYPRARTAAGLFDYDQRGILDRTHMRFFTRRSFRRTVAHTGLTTTAERYAGLPLDVLGVDGVIGRSAGAVDRLITRLWPTMFAYQFVVRLEAAPHSIDAIPLANA